MKDFIITNIDLSNANLQPLSDAIGINEILSILQSIQSKKIQTNLMKMKNCYLKNY